MGSALLNTTSDAEFASGEESVARAGQQAATTPTDSTDALRDAGGRATGGASQAARRRAGTECSCRASPRAPRRHRSAQIAAAVAERYAQTQSYRAFLAAEAERAIQQARAAAEVAAMNAQAVAAAQQRLLEAFDEHADRSHADAQKADVDENGPAEAAGAAQPATTEPKAPAELNLWPDLEPAPAPQPKTHRSRPQASAGGRTSDLEPRTSNPGPQAGLTVRLYEDAASAAHVDLGLTQRAAAARTNRTEERNEAEAHALDEEIAFRQAPVFEEPAGPPVPLPANLIEFPRQLIASRKARPRYAEGPLRDEAEAAPGDGQLRIFEVDPAQIATSPEAECRRGHRDAVDFDLAGHAPTLRRRDITRRASTRRPKKRFSAPPRCLFRPSRLRRFRRRAGGGGDQRHDCADRSDRVRGSVCGNLNPWHRLASRRLAGPGCPPGRRIHPRPNRVAAHPGRG